MVVLLPKSCLQWINVSPKYYHHSCYLLTQLSKSTNILAYFQSSCWPLNSIIDHFNNVSSILWLIHSKVISSIQLPYLCYRFNASSRIPAFWEIVPTCDAGVIYLILWQLVFQLEEEFLDFFIANNINILNKFP